MARLCAPDREPYSVITAPVPAIMGITVAGGIVQDISGTTGTSRHGEPGTTSRTPTAGGSVLSVGVLNKTKGENA